MAEVPTPQSSQAAATEATMIRIEATLPILVLLTCCTDGHGQSLTWSTQFGSVWQDSVRDSAVDDFGDVYVGGATNGDIGRPLFGNVDAFISKVDADSGNVLWSRQFGVRNQDIQIYGMGADGAGAVYASGETTGGWAAGAAGAEDVFLVKYNLAGDRAWARQFGTQEFDRGAGVAADGLGNVFLAGYTRGALEGVNLGGFDAFVAKYDAFGSQVWLKQFGTAEDDSLFGIDVDGSGNVIVVGKSAGDFAGTNLGGTDGIAVKFDSNGDTLWARQFGSTADEEPVSVVIDDTGAPIIVGATRGDLAGPFAGGLFDGFVKKLTPFGSDAWEMQFGTPEVDIARDVAVDPLGRILVAGITKGSLAGPYAGGSGDAFLLQLDSAGEQIWRRQFGTDRYDDAKTLVVDHLGRGYFAGETEGPLFGDHLGSKDAFVGRLNEVPEPTPLLLTTLAVSVLALQRWARC